HLLLHRAARRRDQRRARVADGHGHDLRAAAADRRARRLRRRPCRRGAWRRQAALPSNSRKRHGKAWSDLGEAFAVAGLIATKPIYTGAKAWIPAYERGNARKQARRQLWTRSQMRARPRSLSQGGNAPAWCRRSTLRSPA